jgi:Photosynthetic reaction centre cytochrome C subunit
MGAVVLAAVTFGQNPPNEAPQSQIPPETMPQANGPGQQGMRGPRNFPPPTNLKVLPQDLTGAQVRDVMRHWAGDLGVECSTCHAQYADHRAGRNGRPELDYASDEKPEKQMARIMYTMTETIKKDYVAKVAALDTMGSPAAPVTCGTCHRGNLDPTEYVPPQRERGPRPGDGPGNGPAGGPQGAPPPQGN